MLRVDVQLNPAHADWPALRDAARQTEARGFDAVWVFDHLAGRTLGGDRMLECFTLLGAVAEATSTIELGTLVANVWNRRPGTLVTAAASVALISGRPFHLGIGAGSSPESRWSAEQHLVGSPVAATIAQRHARVEQVLDLTDRLWRADRDAELASFPLPCPPPARIVGTNSVRLSELAGQRADGVNVAWDHPRRDELLAAAARAAGDRPFALTVWAPYDPALTDADHPARREMAAAAIDRLILVGYRP